MSTFLHCSMVGVVPLCPQIGKIIQSALVSCVLNHHDVNVILHNGRLDGRGLCNGALCVPMYQLDVVCSTCWRNYCISDRFNMISLKRAVIVAYGM